VGWPLALASGLIPLERSGSGLKGDSRKANA